MCHRTSSLGLLSCHVHCGGLSATYGTTRSTCGLTSKFPSLHTKTLGGRNFYTFVRVSFRGTRSLFLHMCRRSGGRLRYLVTSVNVVGVYRHATVGGRFCSCHGDTLQHVGHVDSSHSTVASPKRLRQLGCTHSRFFVTSTVCCCCLRRRRRSLRTVGRVGMSRTLRDSATRLLCCCCVGKSNNVCRTSAPRSIMLNRFGCLVRYLNVDERRKCVCFRTGTSRTVTRLLGREGGFSLVVREHPGIVHTVGDRSLS